MKRDHMMGWKDAIKLVHLQDVEVKVAAVMLKERDPKLLAFEKGNHSPGPVMEQALYDHIDKSHKDPEPMSKEFWDATACMCGTFENAGRGRCQYCSETDFDERTFDCRPREDGWYSGTPPVEGDYHILTVHEDNLKRDFRHLKGEAEVSWKSSGWGDANYAKLLKLRPKLHLLWKPAW